jgi:molybdenum cofactor synthesis domain-containing protein
MSFDGELLEICTSDGKGTPKQPIERATLLVDHGIDGDGHAGPGHRQVSALADESIQRMQKALPDIVWGAFAENLVTQGVDWTQVAIGRRFRIGSDAVLQVTQRGKVCHNRCAIYYATGDCIMPTEGMFFVVRKGGEIVPGDRITTDPELDRLRFATITVSDRSSAGQREDLSGPTMIEVVNGGLDAVHVAHETVPDVKARIAAVMRRMCETQVVDVILTSGGTGLAPRDVTPEATRDVIDREIPGIAEAIRAAGLAKTPHAMLSRAICGHRGRTLIVNLSGSPKAVTEQIETLLPTLPHAVATVSGVPQDCARTD